ncbi:MAG: hypothetical protein ACM3SM_15110 [Bacteroidota bacterium]
MKAEKKKINAEDVTAAISAAYGDGPFYSRIPTLIRVFRNSETRNIYRHYRAAAKEVHKIRMESCPDYVIDGLKSKKRPGEIKIFGYINYPKLAFTMATVILLAAATVFYLNQKPDMYTPPVIAEKNEPAAKPAAAPSDTRSAVAAAEIIPRHSTAVKAPAAAPKKVRDEIITKQIKQSLALVADVFQKTDSKIENNNPFEIVDKQLNKSIRAVNELLNGGKDEM